MSKYTDRQTSNSKASFTMVPHLSLTDKRYHMLGEEEEEVGCYEK